MKRPLREIRTGENVEGGAEVPWFVTGEAVADQENVQPVPDEAGRGEGRRQPGGVLEEGGVSTSEEDQIGFRRRRRDIWDRWIEEQGAPKW